MQVLSSNRSDKTGKARATWVRQALGWAALVAAMSIPIILAATSPLLAWRDPVYIIAGFAGIIALAILLVQPLLVAGYVPGLRAQRARRMHRATGIGLVFAVVIHVAGLWITSPPDVIDALTFTSPTPFSHWGVIAMWAVFAAALLALLKRRLRLTPRVWRLAHTTFALVVVAGSIAHALLIQGTMESVSKIALCVGVAAAMLTVLRTRAKRSR